MVASLVSSRVSTRLSVATEFWSSPSLKTTSERRPGCLPTVFERGEHRVKQCRAAPGRQPVDGAQAHGRLGRPPGQREDVVVERQQGHLVGRPQRR